MEETEIIKEHIRDVVRVTGEVGLSNPISCQGPTRWLHSDDQKSRAFETWRPRTTPACRGKITEPNLPLQPKR